MNTRWVSEGERGCWGGLGGRLASGPGGRAVKAGPAEGAVPADPLHQAQASGPPLSLRPWSRQSCGQTQPSLPAARPGVGLEKLLRM